VCRPLSQRTFAERKATGWGTESALSIVMALALKRHASVGLAPAGQQLSSYWQQSHAGLLPSGLSRRGNN
jgi:hypothetical protein